MSTKQRRIEEDKSIREMHQDADVGVEILITEVGYQADLYLDGKCVNIECRDFRGAPGPKKAIESLVYELQAALERWRQRH